MSNVVLQHRRSWGKTLGQTREQVHACVEHGENAGLLSLRMEVEAVMVFAPTDKAIRQAGRPGPWPR